MAADSLKHKEAGEWPGTRKTRQIWNPVAYPAKLGGNDGPDPLQT